MIFTNPYGSDIEIKEPTYINFSVLPSPKFFKYLYQYLYRRLNPSIFGPHIDFDLLNHRRIVLLAESQNVRYLINQVSVKKLQADQWQKNPNQKSLLLFLKFFPDFYIFLQNVNAEVEVDIACAEQLIGSGTNTTNFVDIKKIIDDLNKLRWTRPLSIQEKNSGVSILGNISEALLELALHDLIDNVNFLKTTAPEIQSYGDFVLMCLPNNLWLSVKSNYARERLLASGYTTDIIGVGFFTDYKEFISQSKIRNFSKVGFLAMYIPDIPITENQLLTGKSTYEEVEDFYSLKGLSLPRNINGTVFIRKLSNLYNDLKILLDEKDIRKRNTITF